MLRIVLYFLIGIPVLIVDAVLIYTFPVRAAAPINALQWGAAGGGVVAYLMFHLLIRRPERLYLWGHELTHLMVAKLFLRQVHGFHITSRSGGKVVIDRTNVAIDLAPYAVPLFNLIALGPFLLFRGQFRFVLEVYLIVAAFLFMMHVLFTTEGFLQGQPDLLRSGRLFSGAVVFFFLLLWVPVICAPASMEGFHGLPTLYGRWFKEGTDLVLPFLRDVFPSHDSLRAPFS